MTVADPYPLLKNGSNMPYYRCEACSHYARKLSMRGWCAACEHQCTEVGQKVREKLARILDV